MNPVQTITMSPSVSIVLPTFNGEADLRRTLPAIRAQNYDGEVEIVAIDSSSRDGSVALLKQFGARVEIIAQSEFGHGKTRNLGVAMANGDIVVFLSQDATPKGEGWLQTLVAGLKNRAIGATFARQLPREDASPFERHLHATLYASRSRIYAYQSGKLSLERLFFSNVCSAARREICLQFPFDETVIMSEDQFFALDVLLGGFCVFYNAKAEVVHSHSYDLGALWRRNFDSGYSLRALPAEKWQRRARFLAQFLAREAVATARQKPGWLLYLPLYEATRVLALLCGSQAQRLPLSWRRKLSLHRGFWDEG